MPEEIITEFNINWITVLIVGAVAFGAILGMFMTSFIMAPKRPSAIKDTPYECGIPPAPYAWSQIHIRKYVFAIPFLIFDVEIIFFYPWAVKFRELGLYGFVCGAGVG
ncbi:MAG: NADH-quinone oxidoreductase subunit A [Proteobacteria bacterium]|nr:NADH-quinone oxidoreductase subunit A [Pseudomonadota bacterium]